jgi:AcrR family transcriptional regulator
MPRNAKVPTLEVLFDPGESQLVTFAHPDTRPTGPVILSPASLLPGRRIHVNLTNIKVETNRAYTMVARAEAAAATAERILDAATEVFWEMPTDQISLDEVARRAGVTVQTVIRRFGGREGLIAAGVQREAERIQTQREVPVGDVAQAVHVLIDHYEALGDHVLKLLAEEDRIAGLRKIADGGRAVHRRWCERVFAAALSRMRHADRERRTAQLVTVCDVYTWKLLRRQAGLSRRQTELAVVELVNSLLSPFMAGA